MPIKNVETFEECWTKEEKEKQEKELKRKRVQRAIDIINFKLAIALLENDENLEYDPTYNESLHDWIGKIISKAGGHRR